MTDDAKAKAREARIKNQEARAARWAADVALKQAAKAALQRVFECEEASPAEILEAARLLAELGRY